MRVTVSWARSHGFQLLACTAMKQERYTRLLKKDALRDVTCVPLAPSPRRVRFLRA